MCVCPLVSNSAAREILNGNWIARLYKFRERVARPCYRLPRPFALTANWHPECYKRSLAIISSDVPRRISESSRTNMDRPVIARAHTFRGSEPNVMRNHRASSGSSRGICRSFRIYVCSVRRTRFDLEISISEFCDKRFVRFKITRKHIRLILYPSLAHH